MHVHMVLCNLLSVFVIYFKSQVHGCYVVLILVVGRILLVLSSYCSRANNITQVSLIPPGTKTMILINIYRTTK